MRGIRCNVAAPLIIAVGTLGTAAALAADPTPEQVLAGRGLKRSGTLYVLEPESDIVPKVTKLQPSYRQLKGLYDKLFVILENQAEYEWLEDQWTLVNEQLRNVQAEIDAHPPLRDNLLRQNWQNLLETERQLQFQYNGLRREVNLRYRRLVPDSEKEQLQRDFVKQREVFVEKSRDLRALADKINEEYNKLKRDDEVKQALATLKLSTKVSVALGPTPEFKKASAWLASALRSTSPESLAPKAFKKKARNAPAGKNALKGNGAGPGKERPGKSATKGTPANTTASGDPKATPE